MAVAVPLGGAAERLWHPVLPVVLFGVALLAHVVAWPVLGWAAADVVAGIGGPGPALAAVHALALGVVMPTVVAATLQVLPVATVQAPPPTWLGLAVAAPLLPGGAALVAGFALPDLAMVRAGAALAAVAVVLFVGLAGFLTWRVRRPGQGDTRLALSAGLALLLAGVVLALLTAAGYDLPLLPDAAAGARAHAVVMLFGAMGLLVIGFSVLLLPMLAVAEPPLPGSARPAIALALAGALLGMAGGASLAAAGIVCGLAAAVLHVARMRRVIAATLRSRLGPEFRLVRLSWALLVLALLAALGVTAGVLPPRLEALVVLLALHGWLLSLLTGVLQRILPFLASMHSVRVCAKPVAVTKLVWAPPLRVHAAGHAAALSLAVAGILLTEPALVVAGAVAGTAGAVALAAFGAAVLARTLRHADAVGPKE
ncbi:hypothetical protein ACM64Y_12605 [Novispirillum sp. DQ9]|uniref:hypothetical protein n=1 Tax=Novispirillum sp. DQ9 TaxID=3398612 RepID=UPI003C7C0175